MEQTIKKPETPNLFLLLLPVIVGCCLTFFLSQCSQENTPTTTNVHVTDSATVNIDQIIIK